MEECEHLWMVSSWKVADHSRTAQELMCQKCYCVINNEGLQLIRDKLTLQPNKDIGTRST